MDSKDFIEYKKDLLEKIDALYQSQELFKVINLLENSELDFDLCNELVRAYINAANKTSDPYSLFEKANLLLDRFSLEGKDNPKHQFYRGYILFKQGLIEDSKIRFERALKFASVSDSKLFEQITTMLSNVNAMIERAEFKGQSEEHRKLILEHVKKNFGEYQHLCSFDNVDIFRIPPTKEHDYNLLVSVGLSAKVMKGKNGSADECVELCFALPSDYKFNPDSKSNFEVFLMIEVIKHLIATHDNIGFGYYLEKESGFSSRTAFNGAMLVGMGDYEKEQQTMILDGAELSFLELLPLRPMELNFRKAHSAVELLNLFKEKLIMITPFISTRDDVCNVVAKM